MTANAAHSTTTIKMPLKSSQLIFVDERIDGKKQPRICSMDEPIIDSLWHHGLQQLLLLTATKIFTYDPKTRLIEPIVDIRPTDNKLFKCFTILNDQSSLLIAYDEWEAQSIERWEPANDNYCWTLADKYPLNLTSNEFIGSILAFQDTNDARLAITIYNHFTEQWRMELRQLETMAYLRSIPLPDMDIQHDCRLIYLENRISAMNWLIYSPMSTKIIVIDYKWRTTSHRYKLPIHRMVQNGKGNQILIQSKNRLNIHTIP
jgi:hypothetical protein